MNDKNLACAIMMCFTILFFFFVGSICLLDMQKTENQELEKKIVELEDRLDTECVERHKDIKILEGEVKYFLTGGWK